MDRMKDWLEIVWGIKERIAQETEGFTSDELWQRIKKETESEWKELKKRREALPRIGPLFRSSG